MVATIFDRLATRPTRAHRPGRPRRHDATTSQNNPGHPPRRPRRKRLRQPRPGPHPSGTTATSRIDAAGVTRLDIAYGFDVRVSLGQPEVVTITYDDNLADLLDVGVDGRTLRIQLQPNSNIDHHPTLRAEVTMARLESSALPARPPSRSPASSPAPICGCWSRAAAGSPPPTWPWTGRRPPCPGPPAWSSPAQPTPQRPGLGGQQPRAGRSPPPKPRHQALGSQPRQRQRDRHDHRPGVGCLQADLHGHATVHQAGHLGGLQHPGRLISRRLAALRIR
jgi:hypothetical protein